MNVNIRYLTTVVVLAVGIVASYTTAQAQIKQNVIEIAETKDAIKDLGEEIKEQNDKMYELMLDMARKL